MLGKVKEFFRDAFELGLDVVDGVLDLAEDLARPAAVKEWQNKYVPGVMPVRQPLEVLKEINDEFFSLDKVDPVEEEELVSLINERLEQIRGLPSNPAELSKSLSDLFSQMVLDGEIECFQLKPPVKISPDICRVQASFNLDRYSPWINRTLEIQIEDGIYKYQNPELAFFGEI